MPNCFQLYPKGSTTPEVLQRVDDKLRAHFYQPPNPDEWLCGWYHVIGFLIACKNDHDLGSVNLRLSVVLWYVDTKGSYLALGTKDNARRCLGDMIKILKYLETHYTSNAWVQIGKY